jgi:hypothetical protein
MKGARITYSREELAWIKAFSDWPRKELHELFVQVWAREDVSCDNIKALCSREGWSAGPEGRRRNKGRSLIFTDDQVAWLHQNAGLSRAEVEGAFLAVFPDSSITTAQIISWRKNHKVTTGRNGRFEKGHVPWTKGRKLPFNASSASTMFKAGTKPHNARQIGYETVNRDGYVLICVDRPNPFRPALKTHMAFKHRERWEAKNGPVPKGMALKCLDGDKTNCDPSNWEAVPKGLLPRLNGKSRRGYDQAPAELKPTILAVAKLEHRLREIGKGEAADA